MSILGLTPSIHSKGKKIIVIDNNYRSGVYNGQILITTSDMVINKLSLLMPASLQNGSLSFYNEYDKKEYLQKQEAIKRSLLKKDVAVDALSLCNEYNLSKDFFPISLQRQYGYQRFDV